MRSHGYSAADCSGRIDPTVSIELQQIGDVAGIFSWLGSEESQRTAALRVLGGGQPRLRDLVHLLADLWHDTVRDLRVPQGKTERDLTALEVGHVGMNGATHPAAALGSHRERRSGGSCTDPKAADSALVVHSPRTRVLAPSPSKRHGRATAQALGSSGSSVGLRARAPSVGKGTGKFLPTSSGCEEQSRTSSRPWSKSVLSIRSLPPTWSLLPISHSSDLIVRGCSTNSFTSIGPSCLTAPGNGRSCLDHLPSSFGGRHSGCTALHYVR